MKTKFITIGAAIAATLFLFASCDQKGRYKRVEEQAAESQLQSVQEYALALSQSGGDAEKAKALVERKSLERSLSSVTTMQTASGQKIHYFRTEGDYLGAERRNFQVMLSVYFRLFPDEQVVSIAGDSEGSSHEGNGSVSRHKGYHVVTEKVKP
jgi:hypothetical protein